MNTILSLLIINGSVLKIGDKVKVNNDNDIAVDSVFRQWRVSDKNIELWFSKNNFSAQSYKDEDYDVVVRHIWLDDIDRCINEMNLQIIK